MFQLKFLVFATLAGGFLLEVAAAGQDRAPEIKVQSLRIESKTPSSGESAGWSQLDFRAGQ